MMGDISLLRQLGTILDRPSRRQDAATVRDLLIRRVVEGSE